MMVLKLRHPFPHPALISCLYVKGACLTSTAELEAFALGGIIYGLQEYFCFLTGHLKPVNIRNTILANFIFTNMDNPNAWLTK